MADIKELKDEELKQVNGGFEFIITSISRGDCFSYVPHPNLGTYAFCKK